MLLSMTVLGREPVPAKTLPGSSVCDYESVRGRAEFAVDPEHAANQFIVDLRLAEQAEDRRVHCTADWWVLRPLDTSATAHTLLFDVVNRGNARALAQFNESVPATTPGAPLDFGNGWLLERGMTVAAVGWQADIVPGENLLSLSAPRAQGANGPITGPVRMTLIPSRRTRVLPLLDTPNHSIYPPVDLNEPGARLTVRRSPYDEPQPISRERWAFARESDGGMVSASARHLRLEEGFVPGRVYEVVYTAADPVVAGLGFAVTRDFVSFLRHDAEDSAGQPNPLWHDGAPTFRHVIGFGASQSGRFLRHFLYEGSNADESGRKVFDGVFAHIAGAGRGSFNHRFAQPTRTRAHANGVYPIEVFPFADALSADPLTGTVEGLLDRARRDGVVPKVFQTNSSAEYWGAGASLIHTTADGRADLPIPDDVRIYHVAGTQHAVSPWPAQQGRMPGLSFPLTTYPALPTQVPPVMRALLVALEAWVADGKPPPPSAFPRIDDGTLVTRDRYLEQFPAIHGVEHTEEMGVPRVLDYGPHWSEGIIDVEPPGLGATYGALVPAVDRDGNEIAGLRPLELRVPLATYTGWNRRHPSTGEPGLPHWIYGSYFPFPTSPGSAGGDPRPPIGTRYNSRDDFLREVDAAIADLEREGLLLARDAAAVRRRAEDQWDGPPLTGEVDRLNG